MQLKLEELGLAVITWAQSELYSTVSIGGLAKLSSSAAMSLRRPLLLRWSAYNDECLELLDTAPDALPSDKWLCHLVRIQHIAEEVGFQFSMDDPASVISLSDTKTQYHLKAFERQLEEWQQHAPMDVSQRKAFLSPWLIVSAKGNDLRLTFYGCSAGHTHRRNHQIVHA
jgi:hypothetical protein